MFGKKKKKEKKYNKKDVGTVISQGTKIEGRVEVAESIRIDGGLEGELFVKGDVFIGKTGRLEADIEADNVMIAGSVEGNVKAEGKLEIVESGKLIGDISISNLIIHDGAIFKGKSTSKRAYQSQKSKSDTTKDKKNNKKS